MKTWRSFPLYVVDDPETGQTTVLPTKRDVMILQESAANIQDESDSLGNGKELVDRKKAMERMAESTLRSASRLTQIADEMKPFAVKEDYEVATPTFRELLEAEEYSKDWVTGVAKIDEGKLTLKLLTGNVRKAGSEPFSETEVGDLHPAKAASLWAEVKAHVQNSADRLPFLLSRLKTLSTAQSATTDG